MTRSQIVRSLRVILPLIALALLSTLFLLARKGDPGPAIPFAVDGPDDAARTPGIGAPMLSTVTAGGARVTLRAQRAEPGPGGGTAQGIALDWVTRDGLTARLTADSGRMQDQALALTGRVDAALSSGWHLTAPSLTADLAVSRMTAAGPLAVTAPFGRLDAAGMVLGPAQGGSRGAQVLELNGGVRLLYRP